MIESKRKSTPFPDSLWAEIAKEVGIHCMRRRNYKKANENFRMSLQKQPNKLDSVFLLANSQAREANLEDGLELLNQKSDLREAQIQIESSEI
jgi:Tfp pilus assembly protein PilF